MDKDKTKTQRTVPIREKLAYGVGDIPGYLPMYAVTGPTLVNQVFNMTLLVPPTLISLAMGAFRMVDAFTDPFVGWLSDRFRSRFGRRRPFMLVGAILMALLMPVVYMVNPDWSAAQLMGWFFGVGLVLLFCNTLFNIPYQSLMMELTPDYHERTSITAYKSFFGKLMGLGLGWTWWFTQLSWWGDPETGQPDTLRGAQALMWVIAGIVLVLGLLPVFFCKERYYHKAEQGKTEGLVHSFKLSFRCRPFLIVLGILFLLKIPDMVMIFTAYLNTYYLFDGNQKEAAFLFGWLSTTTSILAFACIPAVTWISRRLGKERTLALLILFKALSAVGYLIAYLVKEPWLLLLPASLQAPVLSGLFMILPSMLADIADYDELETEERREGTFAAVFSWVFKFSATFFVAMSGPIIDLIGFDAALGADQGRGVFGIMIGILVAFPVVTGVTALFLLKKYPLNYEQAIEIRTALEARRGTVD
jgi:GPH family glycoside/pentoside/hexuronide:cation symporter